LIHFQGIESYDLLVNNLPDDKDFAIIKRRLKQLSENCGGRVIDVQPNTSIIRFTSQSFADRYKNYLIITNILRITFNYIELVNFSSNFLENTFFIIFYIIKLCDNKFYVNFI